MNTSEVKKLMARLAAWCHAKHGRQKELARALGVSDQWVSNWVTGQRIPNLEHGLRIQVFLRRHSLKVADVPQSPGAKSLESGRRLLARSEKQ